MVGHRSPFVTAAIGMPVAPAASVAVPVTEPETAVAPAARVPASEVPAASKKAVGRGRGRSESGSAESDRCDNRKTDLSQQEMYSSSGADARLLILLSSCIGPAAPFS
jgi:hypothetical protein